MEKELCYVCHYAAVFTPFGSSVSSIAQKNMWKNPVTFVLDWVSIAPPCTILLGSTWFLSQVGSKLLHWVSHLWDIPEEIRVDSLLAVIRLESSTETISCPCPIPSLRAPTLLEYSWWLTFTCSPQHKTFKYSCRLPPKNKKAGISRPPSLDFIKTLLY